MTVLDYSAARPGGAVRGFQGVVRYAGALTGSFNISAQEVDELHANGISQIAIVLEQQISAVLNGRSHGAQMTQQALNNTRAAHLPDGLVYMACDDDFTLSGTPTSARALGNMNAIYQSLLGLSDVVGPDNVGLYADYFIIEWFVQNHPGFVKAFWQTEAWSHGLHAQAALFQRATPLRGTPGGCDSNDVLGDWRPRVTGPTAPPAPSTMGRFVGYPTLKEGWTDHYHTGKFPDPGAPVQTLQNAINIVSGRNLVVDGSFGPATATAVHDFQAYLHLLADSIVGPQTWGVLDAALRQHGR